MPGAAYLSSAPCVIRFAAAVFLPDCLFCGSESIDHADAEEVELVVGFIALPLRAHAEVAIEVVLDAERPGELGLVVALTAAFGFQHREPDLADNGELVGDRPQADGDGFDRGHFDAVLVE